VQEVKANWDQVCIFQESSLCYVTEYYKTEQMFFSQPSFYYTFN